VLNYNRSDHIKSPAELELIPGSAEAVAALKQAGWAVIIISNQSGLARGFFDEEALAGITQKLERELAAAGGGFDAVYYCPHAPDAGCGCRKPAPGLVHRAALEHDLDLERCFFVGDRTADVECGQAAGSRTVLVETGLPEERAEHAFVHPDHVAEDLRAAVEWILQQE